ncbi:NmrA family protein [Phlyctema vagabunda]|uniref:NmrA family protein n=1 Tax=Phlyctema vagabunda TaxID=108571 RepID=A0ABR4PVQ3_9HELO
MLTSWETHTTKYTMSVKKQTVLVIGGTGAQGRPVVHALTEDRKYNVHVLTRSAKSTAALEVASCPGVTIIEGDSYDDATLYAAYTGIDLTYVNLNGAALGEKGEIYWGMRIFEIARECGVKHFVWGSLPYVLKLGNFESRFRTGHLDGKGKVADFLISQPKEPMAWTILTSCMYLQMFSEFLAPYPDSDAPDTLVFAAPVGKGSPPMIHLPDLGRYARWVFDTPEKSNGLNLEIATENIRWDHLAKTFSEVTGKKAVFKDLTLDEYFASAERPAPDRKIGHQVDPLDPTLQTWRDDFSGFWNTWKADNVRYNYSVLDEILPTRVKTLKEWMEITGYKGERAPVLKDYPDKAKNLA